MSLWEDKDLKAIILWRESWPEDKQEQWWVILSHLGLTVILTSRALGSPSLGRQAMKSFT